MAHVRIRSAQVCACAGRRAGEKQSLVVLFLFELYQEKSTAVAGPGGTTLLTSWNAFLVSKCPAPCASGSDRSGPRAGDTSRAGVHVPASRAGDGVRERPA